MQLGNKSSLQFEQQESKISSHNRNQSQSWSLISSCICDVYFQNYRQNAFLLNQSVLQLLCPTSKQNTNFNTACQNITIQFIIIFTMKQKIQFCLSNKRNQFHNSIRSRQRPLAKQRHQFMLNYADPQFEPQPHFIDIILTIIKSFTSPINSDQHLDILDRLMEYSSEIDLPVIASYFNQLIDNVDKSGQYDIKVSIYYLILKYVEDVPEINYEFIIKIPKVLEDPCFLEIWPYISSCSNTMIKTLLTFRFRKLLTRLQNLAIQEYELLADVFAKMMVNSTLAYHKFYYVLPYITQALLYEVSSQTLQNIMTCLDVFVNRKIDMKYLLTVDSTIKLKLSKYIFSRPESEIISVIRFVGKIFYLTEDESQLQLQKMLWVNGLIDSLLKRLQDVKDHKIKAIILYAVSNLIANGGKYPNLLLQKGLIGIMVGLYQSSNFQKLKKQIIRIIYNLSDELDSKDFHHLLQEKVLQIITDFIERFPNTQEAEECWHTIYLIIKNIEERNIKSQIQERDVIRKKLVSNEGLARKWKMFLLNQNSIYEQILQDKLSFENMGDALASTN